MNFKDFLLESTSVSDILRSVQERPTFVMIVGGVASGKSYFYEQNLKSIPLIDIDEYTTKWSNGDWEKARKLVGKAIKTVESDLKKMFATGESVVNTGSGASTAGVLNKLRWAEDAGYTTFIILVDVPLKTALERNKKRALKSERNLIPDYKVERTNTAARENFKIFKKQYDFSLVVKT